jgi:hypothetical protein
MIIISIEIVNTGLEFCKMMPGVGIFLLWLGSLIILERSSSSWTAVASVAELVCTVPVFLFVFIFVGSPKEEEFPYDNIHHHFVVYCYILPVIVCSIFCSFVGVKTMTTIKWATPTPIINPIDYHNDKQQNNSNIDSRKANNGDNNKDNDQQQKITNMMTPKELRIKTIITISW